MANIVCQKIWERDINPDSDRLATLGGYVNAKCFVIVDNGPVDAKEYSVLSFRWKDEKL
jgi:hypothetical protein